MNLLYVIWDVDPVIFDLGSNEVRWYGLLLATGFFISYLILSKLMRKEGLKQEFIDKFALSIIIGVVLGLRLGHCLFYNPSYYFSNPIEFLYVWEGGLASHGGAIGILLAIWIFARKQKFSYLRLLERVVLIVPLAGSMVRVGNLMNHEIVGVKTSVPWAFKFLRNADDYLPALESSNGACLPDDISCLIDFWTPRHPTQLYEAIFYFIMFFVFFYIFKKFIHKWKEGTFLGWFLIVLFGFRYLIEFTKVDPVEFDGWTDAIRMGQLLSLPFIILGLIFLGRSYGWFKKTKSL